MGRLFLATLVMSLFFNMKTTKAQENIAPPNRSFSVNVQLGTTKIYPCEPVVAIMTFQNTSKQTQSLKAVWEGGVTVHAEGQNPQSTVQSNFIIELPPPQTRSFQGGQKIEFTYSLQLGMGRKSLFPSPGVYWVQGRFAGIYSAPALVEVFSPSQEDEGALSYVREHSLYRYFLWRDIRGLASDEEGNRYMVSQGRGKPNGISSVAIEAQLSELVRLFPNSRYVSWAKLSLSLFTRMKIEHKAEVPNTIRSLLSQNNSQQVQDYTRQRFGQEAFEQAIAAKKEFRPSDVELKKLQDQITEMAPTLIDPVNARAWIAASEIARERGLPKEQVSLLSKAVDTKAEATLAEEAILLQVVPLHQ
ncbi:hypothetical protein IAD21_02672 [Abditibacteriota bacterium]|nr:hypothetical protein IAD21_02672 [Abditibacteriota bacterium]